MGMMQDLPEEVMSIILQMVATDSCIDLASVSATSPALRGIVNANISSLYENMNIIPLLQFARWSDAQLEFLQNCIDGGNTEAKFWFGLWCFVDRGDWNRARKNLGEAKENNHGMALYVWTLLSVIYGKELEEEDWAKIAEFYSNCSSPSSPWSTLKSFIREIPVLSRDPADPGIFVFMMSCDVPWHYSLVGDYPQCVKCKCDRDADALLGLLNQLIM